MQLVSKIKMDIRTQCTHWAVQNAKSSMATMNAFRQRPCCTWPLSLYLYVRYAYHRTTITPLRSAALHSDQIGQAPLFTVYAIYCYHIHLERQSLIHRLLSVCICVSVCISFCLFPAIKLLFCVCGVRSVACPLHSHKHSIFNQIVVYFKKIYSEKKAF